VHCGAKAFYTQEKFPQHPAGATEVVTPSSHEMLTSVAERGLSHAATIEAVDRQQ
jgi:hypothetical protein